METLSLFYVKVHTKSIKMINTFVLRCVSFKTSLITHVEILSRLPQSNQPKWRPVKNKWGVNRGSIWMLSNTIKKILVIDLIPGFWQMFTSNGALVIFLRKQRYFYLYIFEYVIFCLAIVSGGYYYPPLSEVKKKLFPVP